MRVVEKKFAKIIIFLFNNAHFTILPSRHAVRFIACYNNPFLIFLTTLVCEKNALLHFDAFRSKREREHTRIRVGKKSTCRRFVTGLDP